MLELGLIGSTRLGWSYPPCGISFDIPSGIATWQTMYVCFDLCRDQEDQGLLDDQEDQTLLDDQEDQDSS
jgi:hypothetical protein